MSDTPDAPAPKKPRRLAGADVVLRVPGSLAARWDVCIASQTPGCEIRAQAAALGLCWSRINKRMIYGGDVLRYGGQVIDLLLAEGARYGEIMGASIEAYNLCVVGLAAVEGAEGFSEPPAE